MGQSGLISSSIPRTTPARTSRTASCKGSSAGPCAYINAPFEVTPRAERHWCSMPGTLAAHELAPQVEPHARSADWQAWGSTCGASSCAASVPGIEHQWRSALGVTSDGALIYIQGAALDPLQLAALLLRAGAIRGMQLDINPDWPVFATYDPASDHGLASPTNGHLLT